MGKVTTEPLGILWPPGVECVCIGDHWERRPDGSVEAWYQREARDELAYCMMHMDIIKRVKARKGERDDFA